MSALPPKADIQWIMSSTLRNSITLSSHRFEPSLSEARFQPRYAFSRE